MNLAVPCSLQISLFLMIVIGIILRKKNCIDDAGRQCLTNLCIQIIIPCNIVKSCLTPLGSNVLQSCGKIFAVGFLMQLVCLWFNAFLFRSFPSQRKKVLQYCTIVSNGGFLGNPVAEGIYGSLGLLYASVFLIPMRMVMWSVGTSYFVEQKTDKKAVLKNVLTHPCLVAVYIGLFLMVSGIALPSFVSSPIIYIGNCNAAITMFIIGTILADGQFTAIFNKQSVAFSVFRLLLLPAIAYLVCRLLALDSIGIGVSVIMTGMPAGATAAIFAAQYHSDADFATHCVVLSTILSMFTIPIWCYLVR